MKTKIHFLVTSLLALALALALGTGHSRAQSAVSQAESDHQQGRYRGVPGSYMDLSPKFEEVRTVFLVDSQSGKVWMLAPSTYTNAPGGGKQYHPPYFLPVQVSQ